MYRKFGKRAFDFCATTIFFLLFWWVYLILWYLVTKKLGKPALFTQERPGMDGKIFKMYKFRSMSDDRDENGELLPDEIRLTPFGMKLRSTSLDEIPGLYNVWKGDMSLVGPRPLLVRYLERYSKEQMRRHEVKPGITGWAQVNGRNALSWEEKFKLDVDYVDSYTFFMDIKILFLTVKKVFVKEGISQEGNVTMEEFKGSGK